MRKPVTGWKQTITEKMIKTLSIYYCHNLATSLVIACVDNVGVKCKVVGSVVKWWKKSSAQRCLKQAQLGSSKIEAEGREEREEHLPGLVWTAALSKYCKCRRFNFCATTFGIQRIRPGRLARNKLDSHYCQAQIILKWLWTSELWVGM